MYCVPKTNSNSPANGARPPDQSLPRASRPLLAIALACALLIGCASGPQVSRRAVDEEIDVSGFWNDTDSRLVSEEMVADSLGRVWIDDWRGATGDRPTVIVGAVRNRSSEHINTRTFSGCQFLYW